MTDTRDHIILVGPTGAGKSSIGRILAGALGLPIVDLDREIVRRVGASVNVIFEERDENYFRDRESEALNDLLSGPAIVLATGAGCVLRDENRLKMKQHGFVIHLHISMDEQIRRLARDQTRPLLQSPDREQVLQAMARVRTPLYQEVADLSFDNDIERSAKGACAQLMTQLQRHGIRK